MVLSSMGRRAGATVVAAVFCGSGMVAQQASSLLTPLRTAPGEKLTVNPGFRDWGPTTIAGTTILGGNMTNRGGVVAVDIVSGKVKWTYRPVFNSGTASVSTAPAVSGDIPSPIDRPSGCHFHPRCKFVMDVCRVEYPAARRVGAAVVACHLYEPTES